MLFSAQPNPKTAILLIQFGSPRSSAKEDVHSFLTSVLKEHLLPCIPTTIVHHFVAPWILSTTHTRYQKCMNRTPKQLEVSTYSFSDPKYPSPLVAHSVQFAKKLQNLLPRNTLLALGMLHGPFFLSTVIASLQALPLEKLIIFPLFPLHTSLSTSIRKKTLALIQPSTPSCEYIPSFHRESFFITSCANKLASVWEHDHVLFSFHAIPFPPSSYEKECAEVASRIASGAGVTEYSISFQSKIGIGPWSTPSTKNELKRLFSTGKRKILVMSPSFVVDCTETLVEIEIEYKEYCKKIGGCDLSLVPSLNDDDAWVAATASFLRKYL